MKNQSNSIIVFSRRGIFFLVLCLYWGLSAPAAAQHFRVQSFNAYGPMYAPELNFRTDGLNYVLKDENCCDAILLQEVWSEWHYESIAGVAEGRGLQSAHFDATRGDDLKTGISAFFQGQILQKSSVLYPVNNQGGLDFFRELLGVEKGIGFVTAKLTNADHAILFIDTHTHPTDATVRIAQIVFLVGQVFARLPLTMPIIMGGDLNATPDSLESALLRDVLLLQNTWLANHPSYTEDTCTYCEDNPLYLGGDNRVIDYILYRSGPEVELTALNAEINLREFVNYALSDHYGVRAEFTMNARAAEHLALDDPSFLARIGQARQTIQRARAELLAAEDSQYAESLAYLTYLDQELIQLNPNSTLVNYWRQR